VPNYTAEEIAEFKRKDHRISMQGLLQIILRVKGLEGLDNVSENVALAKRYSDEIWRAVDGNDVADISTGESKQMETNAWVAAAQQAGTKPPTPQEQKVLDTTFVKYMTQEGFHPVITRHEMLQKIIDNHGRYPSKMSSVEKVLKNL
jgi:hypothetical protein